MVIIRMPKQTPDKRVIWVLSNYAPGHGANSQLGPIRPTYDPSGQILASRVHAVGPGQGANSHAGGTLPTYDPSEHNCASAVQAMGSELEKRLDNPIASAAMKRRIIPTKIKRFIVN